MRPLDTFPVISFELWKLLDDVLLCGVIFGMPYASTVAYWWVLDFGNLQGLATLGSDQVEFSIDTHFGQATLLGCSRFPRLFLFHTAITQLLRLPHLSSREGSSISLFIFVFLHIYCSTSKELHFVDFAIAFLCFRINFFRSCFLFVLDRKIWSRSGMSFSKVKNGSQVASDSSKPLHKT